MEHERLAENRGALLSFALFQAAQRTNTVRNVTLGARSEREASAGSIQDGAHVKPRVFPDRCPRRSQERSLPRSLAPDPQQVPANAAGFLADAFLAYFRLISFSLSNGISPPPPHEGLIRSDSEGTGLLVYTGYLRTGEGEGSSSTAVGS